MANLETIIKCTQDRLRDNATLADVMSRPDEDFVAYIKNDGSLGSLMRSIRCPVLLWRLFVFGFRLIKADPFK